MLSYLSIGILLFDATCCSGFRRNRQLPFDNISDGSDISKATHLYREKMQDQRRTNTVATGDVEVTCSICLELGIPLKTEDIIPLPESFPNTTCAEFEYELSAPESKDMCIEVSEFLSHICCDTSEMTVPLYKCTENIQEAYFKKMNKDVAPFLIDKPFVIDVHLSFQALEKIDVKLSTASMFVFLSLNWFDPRLAWNRTHEHCTSTMSVKASINRELTQIWVPDFDLLNRIEGVQSWSEIEAEVRFDGMVLWKRAGVLDIGCTFKGLRKMPFDTLGCQLFFGGYTLLHNIQYNANPGFDNNAFTRSFQEYTIVPNWTTVFYGQPEYYEGRKYLDQHIVVYNFYFKRSSNFYVTKMIIPSILFTFVSFGLFLLDLRLGERLGFGLNILLVNVAQDIITNAFIPISEEKLWLVTFIQASTYWIFAALFETIFVSWIYYKAGKHIEDEKMYHQTILNRDETQQVTNEGIEKKNVPLREESKKEERPDEIILEYESLESLPENEEKDFFDEQLSLRNKTIARGMFTETRNRAFSLFRKIPEIKPPENGDLQLTAEIFIRPLMHMTHKERLVWINRIDRVCMIVYPASYILFIIVMFATIESNYSEKEGLWVSSLQSTSEL